MGISNPKPILMITVIDFCICFLLSLILHLNISYYNDNNRDNDINLLFVWSIFQFNTVIWVDTDLQFNVFIFIAREKLQNCNFF